MLCRQMGAQLVESRCQAQQRIFGAGQRLRGKKIAPPGVPMTADD
jgi:hypothetical protein